MSVLLFLDPTEGSVHVFGHAVLFLGVISPLKLNPSSLMFLFSVIPPSPSVCLEYSPCPRLVSLLCSLICGLSPVLCLFLSFSLPLSLSWGCAWKPSLFYFFFFRGCWIFQFCIFLSLFFVFPLFFFPRPLWCVCGFVIIPFGWAHRLRYAGSRSRTHTRTRARARSVFSYKKAVTSTWQVCIQVCLSVFSMRCSTHITVHTIPKHSAYMKRTFA